MNQARIEWLNRLGIDVWKLRESSSFKSAEASRPSETHAKHAREPVFKGNKQTDESETLVRSDAPSKSSHSITPEPPPTQSEVPKSDSKEEPKTADDPSFELQCLAMGSSLIVFDPGIQDSSEVAKGIGYALCKYESFPLQSVDFRWPPLASEIPQSESSHGGWKSARRAFQSLITHQEWNASILVTVGTNANKVTESLQNSKYTVLKLTEFPSSTQSKKDLWHRIQEIL